MPAKTKTVSTRKSFRPKPLPRKPSALIRAALRDLQEVEKLPGRFKVNMDVYWVRYDGEKACVVCLAGAVMAQRLIVSFGEVQYWSRCPSDYPAFAHRLKALDYFRRGEAEFGCQVMRVETRVCNRPMPYYNPLNTERFYAAMRKLADDFQKEGN